jgi:UDP-N-acetylmuramoyl-L-alanyl-D-glutamate--2,6-diaminopimelate ligase
MKMLQDVNRAAPGLVVDPPGRDVLISGIALDSRRVRAGELFFALSGGAVDGHRYIPDAQERGAAAVVGEQVVQGLSVPYIQVRNTREAMAYLSAAFYGFPGHSLTVIGVTGTDGKTTTSNLIYRVLQAAGLRTGMISTVNALIGDQELDTGFHVTTPDAPDVQRYLAQMVEAGLTHVVLEATSHGLAQDRVTGCEFDLGLVTNVTHEHLDYHGSYEAYRAAKGRLFQMLGKAGQKPGRTPCAAILNRDDSAYEAFAALATVAQLSYGVDPHAQVRADSIELSARGLAFLAEGVDLNGSHFRFRVSSPMVGSFNVSNCLAAIALTRAALGLPDDAVVQGIRSLKGVPGRMEAIDLGQDFAAFVDFAHTPNALRNALQAARALTSGRLIAVFGSAGLRDRQKRRMMAETSAELADLTVLTAEDPRSESLEEILAQMAEGMCRRGAVEGKNFWRIPDRREAIRFALQQASADDLVIACGKGHEQSMCFGETEYAWDDRQAMRAALAERLGVPGPEMPFLPEWG